MCYKKVIRKEKQKILEVRRNSKINILSKTTDIRA